MAAFFGARDLGGCEKNGQPFFAKMVSRNRPFRLTISGFGGGTGLSAAEVASWWGRRRYPLSSVLVFFPCVPWLRSFLLVLLLVPWLRTSTTEKEDEEEEDE